MYHVYVLQSEKLNRKYIGSCEDLDGRLDEHNKGYSQATKPYRPWKLIHFESFPTRSDAVKREMFFKSKFGRTDLNRILKHKGRVTA